jgi:serine/threonine protein kinase
MQETSFSVGPIPGLEIVRSVGRGSVAEVFLAREPALGRLVALKVVHAEVAADRTGRSRFEREGLAAARVAHDGIVQVHRVGETADGRPYLVMEYVKGRNFEDRLGAEGPLPIEVVKKVILDLARALQSVHQHDIVHRDVRPGNVLEEDETGRIVLSDFGLAALLESGESTHARLTVTGQLLGDVNFITPEQLRGERVTVQADVYQLGVLAHWLATGGGPFGALPTNRLIGAHLESEPHELVGRGGATDPEFAAIVRRCLSKNPARRPTAADLVRQLGGEGSPAASDFPGMGLIRRRVPHFVLASIAGGYVFVNVVSTFIQNAYLPQVAFTLSLVLAAHGVVAASVISWFHGARGKQEVRPVEVVLLGVVGASFFVISALILLGRA